MIAALLPYRWIAIALLAAAAIGYIGILRGEVANEKAAIAKYRADVEREARITSEAARVEEQRRMQAQKETNDETQRLAARGLADARGADAASPGVRNAFAATLQRAAACHPTTQPAVETAGTAAARVLADVFGEIETRSRALAAEADRRRPAGLGCQREYESLTPKNY